ncbi:MAG: hypothetical protein LUG18_14100 [Candidatus Azobacteroides sp.]|nr:hypothetical protein [Candidatus Azobacteroides sp.]
MEKLYKEEIKELTNLLNEERTDLKEQLEKTGISTDNALLAGYQENEDGEETGILYTDDMLIRFTATMERICVQRVSTEEVKEEFPQVMALKHLL